MSIHLRESSGGQHNRLIRTYYLIITGISIYLQFVFFDFQNQGVLVNNDTFGKNNNNNNKKHV